MLTHQNLSANARQVAALDPDRGRRRDRMLGVLPFFHVFANTCVLNRTVVTGGEIVMLPRFDGGQVLAAIDAHQADRAARRADDVPGAARPSEARARPISRRCAICISGGAPLSAELKARFEAATGATRDRGLWPVRKFGRGLVQPLRRAAASPARSASRCPARASRWSTRRTRHARRRRASPARSSSPGRRS